MKIILSRKGFDSSYGGYPSPILPDGSLLSIPIPSMRFVKKSQMVKINGSISMEVHIYLLNIKI